MACGIAAQLTATSAPAACGLARWNACATPSLPLPVSPRMCSVAPARAAPATSSGRAGAGAAGKEQQYARDAFTARAVVGAAGGAGGQGWLIHASTIDYTCPTEGGSVPTQNGTVPRNLWHVSAARRVKCRCGVVDR